MAMKVCRYKLDIINALRKVLCYYQAYQTGASVCAFFVLLEIEYNLRRYCIETLS